MGYVKNRKPIKYGVNYNARIRTTPYSFNYYLKTLIRGINYLFFLLLSLIMLISFGKDNHPYEENIKKFIIKISTPELLVVKGVNGFIRIINDVYYYIINTKSEIKRLRQDNFSLKQQLLGMDSLKRENSQLKKIINITGAKNVFKYKSIKLNILNRNIYSSMANSSSNYGTMNGFSEGDFVIDNDGNLVGRLINVLKNSSEILLITDNISKILAKTEKSKINIILSGNGSKILDIHYIEGEDYNFEINENVFVSFDNNIGDFDVGTLVRTRQGFAVRVKSKFNKINEGIVVAGSSTM
jgi:cell shape-determining protein MreC